MTNKRDLHRIFTSPVYDTTDSAQLVSPLWNQVRTNDPLTQIYPDCTLPRSTCTQFEGCDFLSSSSFNLDFLDIALTIRLNRLKILPPHFSSSRHRVSNILFRKWWIAKNPRIRGTTKMHLPIIEVQCEIASCCGTMYRSSFMTSNKTDQPIQHRVIIPVNSCLKHTQEIDNISPQWFHLLKRTLRSSTLMKRLAAVITKPKHSYPISRSERLMDELSPFLYPALESMEFPVTQRRKVNGFLIETPSTFGPCEFKLCHEFPGLLKRSPFCKVSFHWGVDTLDFKEDDDVDSISIGDSHLQPLKIDKLGNQYIYYLPLYPDQKSDSAVDLEELADTVGQDATSALFVQPIGFAAPLWELDAGIRATSPDSQLLSGSMKDEQLPSLYDPDYPSFEDAEERGKDLLDYLAIGHKMLAGFVHSFL